MRGRPLKRTRIISPALFIPNLRISRVDKSRLGRALCEAQSFDFSQMARRNRVIPFYFCKRFFYVKIELMTKRLKKVIFVALLITCNMALAQVDCSIYAESTKSFAGWKDEIHSFFSDPKYDEREKDFKIRVMKKALFDIVNGLKKVRNILGLTTETDNIKEANKLLADLKKNILGEDWAIRALRAAIVKLEDEMEKNINDTKLAECRTAGASKTEIKPATSF